MAELKVDTASIARRVESGEYFKEAKAWYSAIYEAPIAHRCYFVVIIALTLINTFVAVQALNGLLPIRRPVPFIMYSQDAMRERPTIRPMDASTKDANLALMRFFLGAYVTAREEYDLDRLETNANFVRNYSEPELFNAYRRMLDPQNPRSPIVLYERHTSRAVRIQQVSVTPGSDPMAARVDFEAELRSAQGVLRSRWSADIAFRYKGIEVNQETGAVTPMAFSIVSYNVKENMGTAQ